jgi:DNA-binding transcriptional ArsR family regulator
MNDEPNLQKNRILPDDMFTIQDLETLKVVADPLRLQILNVLRGSPRPVKELAKALHLPQTKLYYHIDLLEKHGLIRVTSTRVVSGILEKHYQATAYKLTVDRALFWPAPSGPDDYQGLDVFLSAVLDYTHNDILRSVQAGLIDVGKGSVPERSLDIGRIWFRLTPEQVKTFRERLEALCIEYQTLSQQSPTDGTQFYEFLQAFYPTLEHSPSAREEQMGISQWKPSEGDNAGG